MSIGKYDPIFDEFHINDQDRCEFLNIRIDRLPDDSIIIEDARGIGFEGIFVKSHLSFLMNSLAGQMKPSVQNNALRNLTRLENNVDKFENRLTKLALAI